jgi:hypothetical protein
MHTSNKELNNGITRRKEGISNHEQKAVANKAVTINRDPRPKDLKQNESTTRIESWQRVRKEEYEGESEQSRVSKVVLAKFGHLTNQKVKRRGNAPYFSAESRSCCCRNIRGLYNAMNGQMAHM